MAVISFSSLKGGVGKTTLAVSVASAFAERGCQTLLIDLDPCEHASNFFDTAEKKKYRESPLARLFLSSQIEGEFERLGSLIEAAMSCQVPLVTPVRSRFAVLPSGPELRHFLWGKGARSFRKYFPKLIEELNSSYDYIIIDTSPDFNVITRNAIAASDLVVVPVDSSLMSINCLEQLVANSAHIRGPVWSIIRTMVNRQASTVQRLSTERLYANLALCSSNGEEEEVEAFFQSSFDGQEDMFALLDDEEESAADKDGNGASQKQSESPIFLLNSVVYRSEIQNKLTFMGKSAFDSRSTSKLAEQYMQVARELEQILTLGEENEALFPIEEFMPQVATRAQAS